MKINFPYYKNFSARENFIIGFSLLLLSYASVWFLGKNPLLAAVPIAMAGALFLFYTRSWKLFLVYFLFALGGTLQEIFFISKGFWSYTSGSFLSVPLYLPFVWGNIGAIAIGAFKNIIIADKNHRLLHRPPGFRKICLILFLTAAAALIGIRMFAQEPVKLIAVFLVIDILFVLHMRSLPLAIVGLFAMAGGTIGDLIAVALNLWNYPLPNTWAGVPPYIFIGWDVVGLLIVGFYLALDAPDAPIPRWMKDKI
jgi:uncharacterized membrane protein YoaT (DUF817 family)